VCSTSIPSLVTGGVDFLGGQIELRVARSGRSTRSRPYHGRLCADSWHASSKLTFNYGLRWDWFSREQESQSNTANMVPARPRST
jgi:hypothetical protein